jgi:hypothetical protein
VQHPGMQPEAMQQACEPIDSIFHGTISVAIRTLEHPTFPKAAYSLACVYPPWAHPTNLPQDRPPC